MRIETIDELADVLAHSALMTMEVEGDGWSLTLERSTGPASAPLAPPAGASGHASAFDEAAAHPELSYVEAEVVGVFHELPSPVAPGQHVKSGEVLGTIDALTIRNDVRSPLDGEVTAVQVEDGQPVEYGQALFAIGRFGET